MFILSTLTKVSCVLAKELSNQLRFLPASNSCFWIRKHYKMTIASTLNLDNINNVYDNIVKPATDKRQYRGLELKNGLKVLLISDSETDKSAASLDVNIGAFSDPRELQGLAHFLEHMLFLGTEKYPEENEYQKFISSHGGMSNAYTSGINTNYYFDISPEFLALALDIFAQFFLCPLFTESATERELNAVNSEHEKNIVSDVWRIHQLEKSLANPNHDYNKFSTGNLQTLSIDPKNQGIDVRNALLDFHSKWYSSNIMSLCVLGKESLDELTRMTAPLFSSIPNKNVVAPSWSEHPYSSDYLQKNIYIVPIKDCRNLYLNFPMPDLLPFYKTKPGHYLAHLIGHEGPGSLLSELKSRGLCSYLNCYYRREANGFGFFNITVDLTEKGIDKVDEIITLIFQYINMLKKEGPKKWIFDECQKINDIRFQFKDKERPMSKVTYVTSVLQDYPITEVLSAGHLFKEYEPTLIMDVLKRLIPENIVIVEVAKKYKDITDSKEKWYQTDYKIVNIKEDKLNVWKNSGLNDNLSLPTENEFIASNLNLTNREDNLTSTPLLIKNSSFSRIWFMQDNDYLLPKAFYGFIFTNPLVYANPLQCNAARMFTRLFSDALNEYAYSAQLADVSYDLSTGSTELILEVEGYNDKLKVLLLKVINKMTQFQIDPKRFEILKENYVRGLKNHVTRPLQELISYNTALITIEKYWPVDQLLSSAVDLSVEHVQQFIKDFFSEVHIEALFHGNVTKNEAIEMTNLVEEILLKNSNTVPLPESKHIDYHQVELENGQEYVHETTNEVHSNKAIGIYLQIGTESVVSNATIELLSQLLREPFFNRLRTQEQLGYITYTTLRRSNGVQGLSFFIQSDKMPAFLDERIESFLNWAEDFLKNMTDDEFETNKNALITRRLEKPKQILGFSRKLWREIYIKMYFFDRDPVEVEAIKSLYKSDVLYFFENYVKFDAANRKKLSVRIIGANGDQNEVGKEAVETSKVKLIENIEQFKKGLKIYPIPEPRIDVKTNNKL